jgi:hypothetical protein
MDRDQIWRLPDGPGNGGLVPWRFYPDVEPDALIGRRHDMRTEP